MAVAARDGRSGSRESIRWHSDSDDVDRSEPNRISPINNSNEMEPPKHSHRRKGLSLLDSIAIFGDALFLITSIVPREIA